MKYELRYHYDPIVKKAWVGTIHDPETGEVPYPFWWSYPGSFYHHDIEFTAKSEAALIRTMKAAIAKEDERRQKQEEDGRLYAQCRAAERRIVVGE